MEPFVASFSPMVLDDIKHAVTYYEALKPGLGERFNHQPPPTLNAIRRNAHFASLSYDDIRTARIKKFPYLVHFHVAADKEVTVVAVYSTYKQPVWEQ